MLTTAKNHGWVLFLQEQLPYTIYSGVQFFERREIKDALSYLRLIAYRDDLSFMRVANSPKRNLGQRRMRFLRDWAEQNQCSLYQALCCNLEDEVLKGAQGRRLVSLVETFGADYGGRPVSELLSDLLDQSGYEEMLRTEGSQARLDNLAELKQSVYEYETGCGEECTLEHYLAHVALFSNADAAQQGDRVKLMTVHAAKGLEFPYVFLCGLNEGVFPSRKITTRPGLEEERRLAFVAVTRAEQGLYLSEAEGWNLDGSNRFPSRFILDVDPDLLSFTQPPQESLLLAARDYVAQAESRLPETEASPGFEPGQRVRHNYFGLGTVREIDLSRQAYIVSFDDIATPRAVSFRTRLEGC